VQVHTEHAQAKLGITDKLLGQHDDSDSPLAFCQLSCPTKCLLREAALRCLTGKAAGIGVERLFSFARCTLMDHRRSMNTPRLVQLLQVKMNGHLLEGGRLSHCADDFMRMVEEEAGFNSIYEDLAQMEEMDLASEAIGGGDGQEAAEHSKADDMSAGEDGVDSELDLFE
jgi:hypothetical protein